METEKTVVRNIKEYTNQKTQVDPCGGKNQVLCIKTLVQQVKKYFRKKYEPSSYFI